MAQAQRHVCPECGRAVAAAGGISWTLPPRRPFVHLRRHNNPDGSPCPGRTSYAVIADATPTRPPDD